jgi:hypothetical protein
VLGKSFEADDELLKHIENNKTDCALTEGK